MSEFYHYISLPLDTKIHPQTHSPALPALPSQTSLRTCQSEVLPSRRKKQKSSPHFSWFLPVICAWLGRSAVVPRTFSCVPAISRS